MGQYFKKLVGDRVYLSPIDPDDAPVFTRWLADLELTKYLLGSSWVLGLAAEREALTKMAQDQNNLVIVEAATDRLIGICGFGGVDQVQGTAEIGIFLGEKEVWGLGYGTEALGLLLDFGFNVRNYHNIMLRVKAFNTRAVRCYQKLGFRTFGTRREVIRNGSTYTDEVYMDLLAREFQGTLERSLTR